MFQSASSVSAPAAAAAGSLATAEQECLAGGMNQALTWKRDKFRIQCAFVQRDCTDQLLTTQIAADLSFLLRGSSHTFLKVALVRIGNKINDGLT